MSTYFLHDGNEQKGPFTFEELINKSLSKNTNIWKEGTSSWVKAEELDELKVYLKTTSSPLTSPTTVNAIPPMQIKPKKKFPLGYVLGFLLLGVVAVYFWNQYNNRVEDIDLILNSSTTKEKSPEELKAELISRERENPTRYLDVTGTYRKNLIGETVLEGKITNTATLAVFKDVVIKASYMGPSGTIISEENFTKYQLIYPRGAIEFKFKTFAPKQTETVSINIEGASPAE